MHQPLRRLGRSSRNERRRHREAGEVGGLLQSAGEHRFRKGQSGNPRDRPPKTERSLLPRQARNDILKLALKPVRTRTPNGEKMVPAVEALQSVLLAKAASGHLPSIRYFLGLYHAAIDQHFEAHRTGAYDILESLERGIQLATEPVSRELLEHVNRLRACTRVLDSSEVLPTPPRMRRAKTTRRH